MKQKFLSILIALALCLGLLPGTALAAEDGLETRSASINMDYTNFVFAQGVPIVIKQNGNITSIYDTDNNLLSGETDVSSYAIYGGWFDGDNTHTANTSVTMESGTVKEIYGGSYSGTLEGDTNITIQGGTAVNVSGGGVSSTVTGTAHVDFYGGNVTNLTGGGYQDNCAKTHVRFMGQADGFIFVCGGGNSGTVGTATVEFHGQGTSANNQSIYVYGSGWGDHVDEVKMIIGKECEPPATPIRFSAKNPDDETSTVGSASFDVTMDPARPSMMNSSGLDGTGVTGKVSAYIHSDASMDHFIYTSLTEIDELILEGVHYTTAADDLDLDRLEIQETAAIAVSAIAGKTRTVRELAGGGRIYFEKRLNMEASITPITVGKITTAEGARLQVDRLGGLPDTAWTGAALFTGPGVTALETLDGLVCVNENYALTKEGSTIKVKENDGQRQAYLDPTPSFDRQDKTYRYGETINIATGLQCGGVPLPGLTVSITGGASGSQTFATGVTDEDGRVTIPVPVNDMVWNSRTRALGAYFAGTEEYKGNAYGVSVGGDLNYTILPAQVTLSGEITAPARGGVPVKTLTVGGADVCTAEVLWSPADAAFRPEVSYTASIRLVPKAGYGLDKGQIGDSVTYKGQSLALPAQAEADGSLIIADVQTFPAFPAIHPTGVTLNKTECSLTVGGSEQLTATVAPADADNKSVTWTSSDPAVATVVDGTVTAVSAGTATITVTTADGNKTDTCTVTVRSSGGGGGGGSSTLSVTVPVSGDKDTVRVSASVSGTTATVSKIDTKQIDSVVGDSAKTSMVEIDFTGLNKTIDTVKLPAAAIKDIAAKAQDEKAGGLTVKLPGAEISFDAPALSAVQAQVGSQITLTVTPAKPAALNSRQKKVVGASPVFDLTLRSSSGAITDFRGGCVTVSLPYTLAAGQDPSGVVVYYLDSTGNITPCATVYDAGRKSAVFTTGHLSLYFVGYDPAAVWTDPYTDVAKDAWYYDAVRYVSENGLMGGYGNGLFGPDDVLSRAQFAQILYNKEGKPTVTGGSVFTDVAPGAWYANAVTWAAAQGIVNGYGSRTFGPNDDITREQLIVMLWRYAGSPTAAGRELRFADADKAGAWAEEALCWAVENGIIHGQGNGKLDPQGLATRAQVAQMLQNFLER